ncbi:MAG: ATP-binding protein [Abditibacteriales bacterium]|nr:ATP-binding protein [Abditibacteriales bacterium]MDW8367894.1 ATP-binding protein [Abditibacteriales bacterium]
MVEVRFPSELGMEKCVMDIVGTVAHCLGFPNGRVADLKMAVGEACLNAMEHGNQFDRRRRVIVRLSAKRNGLEVSVTDSGQGGWDKVINTPPPDLQAKLSGESSLRGWGMFLIRHLVDEVEFLKSSSGGHQLRMMVYRQPGQEEQEHVRGTIRHDKTNPGSDRP